MTRLSSTGFDATASSTAAILPFPAQNGQQPPHGLNGAHAQPAAPATRNEPTFEADASAVVRLGPIVTSFKRIGLAIRDPRCGRHHLRVLYAFMEKLNQRTGTAFPSRRAVADQEGMEPEQVENALYDLRKWGYIDWERRAEPDLHRGRLLHYTLPAARWSEEDITKAILEWLAKQKAKSTQRAVYFHEKYTAPHGEKVHSGLCTPAESTQPAMPKSTQPAMTRNLLREPERKNTHEALDDAGQDPNDGARQRKRTAPKATEEQFDRFWVVYPKREGKAEARKKLLTLSREDAELAIAGAEAYAKKCQAERTEPKYVKWPQGWLSERRFEDFAPGSSGAVGPDFEPYWFRDNPAVCRAIGASGWGFLIKQHAANGTWSQELLGPPPGDPGCVIPRDLLRDLSDLLAKLNIKKGSQ